MSVKIKIHWTMIQSQVIPLGIHRSSVNLMKDTPWGIILFVELTKQVENIFLVRFTLFFTQEEWRHN